MWWAMTKKELAERDRKQREAIELWAETTDWPAQEKSGERAYEGRLSKGWSARSRLST
jgi:hypothetical protein